MTNKSTHWVTIPEETIYTPASEVSEISNKIGRKNKIFWGAGFVILVIFTIALVAPQQTANVFQGSLFEEGFQSLEIIPPFEEGEEATEEGSENGIESNTEEGTDEETSDLKTESGEASLSEKETEKTVVEAETEAVSIQLEPVAITIDEPAEEDEETAEEKDEMELSDDVIEVTEEDLEDMTIEEDFISMPLDHPLADNIKVGTVLVGTLDDEDFLLKVESIEETDDKLILEVSEADMKEAYKSIEEPVEEQIEEEAEVPSSIKEELDANRQLLEELSKQIAEFRAKDEEKTEIIEDLTDIVEDQINGEMRASAPETTTIVSTVPSSAITTSTLGQIPGYRVNTHIVSTTPQQVLQQNTVQVQMNQQMLASITPAEVQEDYQAQLSSAQGTPESGPKEALLLAITLAFVALLGWKLVKVVRA